MFFFRGKLAIFSKPPNTRAGGFGETASLTVSLVGQQRVSIFFSTSSSYSCTHATLRGRRMEGELIAKGEDSMLPLTVEAQLACSSFSKIPGAPSGLES